MLERKAPQGDISKEVGINSFFLGEYLLVHPDTREVHLFRRGADQLFTLHDLTGREQIGLDSIGCELLSLDVFDGVEPPAEQPAQLPG